ncbi:MAG: DUF262 domain-containing protein [bacterium]|nr:DUF262 domain-containing protein [bacterium]
MTQSPEFLDEQIDIEEIYENEDVPFRYTITNYGADYDVEGLVRRIERGDIYIPDFQRVYVWDIKRASKFIESLLLGLPIPGIFLSREEDTQKFIVIDGQQRLRTLLYFYKGWFGDAADDKKSVEFKLQGVHKAFEGLTYSRLSEEDRRRLDNALIHATIVRQDEPEPNAENSSIYFIFERLNTGGVALKPQDIRSAIYHGSLNNLLHQLNMENEDWQRLFGKPDKQRRDEELILRFFALYFWFEQYEEPMKGFLNSYMAWNRGLDKQSASKLTTTFNQTVSTVLHCLGEKAFKPKRAINAAIFDAIMVGVARRLEQGEIQNCLLLRERYNDLLNDTAFQQDVGSGTANREKVQRRIELATQAFADVE